MLPRSMKMQAKTVGKLHLVFEMRRNQTKLVTCYQQVPLKASRTLYIEPDTATVFLMESSGGMVSGDELHYDVVLKPHTQVHLLPQSAVKVYPASEGERCLQTVRLDVGDEAQLEWGIEEVIPFQQSSFVGQTHVHLTRTSSFLWSEIIYPGRAIRGEKFQYTDASFHMEIWKENDLLVYDPVKFVPSKQQLNRIGLLESHAFIGTLFLIVPSVTDKEVQALRACLSTDAGSVTSIDGHGLMVRWLTSDLPLLKREMKQVRAYIKANLY